MSDPVKILLIDDHSIVVDGCAALLHQHGYQLVLLARSCEEGLQLVRKEEPALAIIDISMPGIGGLGVIRRIKKGG